MLEPKIKCRFCQKLFELFEDLQGHRCKNTTKVNQWLRLQDEKIQSFEAVVETGLTKGKNCENIEHD